MCALVTGVQTCALPISDRLASDGQHVLVFDALARRGVVRNLEWLMSRHPSRITPIIADIRDATTLGIAVGKARAVFHLAAQRSEERRVGKECVSTCRSRWSPDN